MLFRLKNGVEVIQDGTTFSDVYVQGTVWFNGFVEHITSSNPTHSLSSYILWVAVFIFLLFFSFTLISSFGCISQTSQKDVFCQKEEFKSYFLHFPSSYSTYEMPDGNENEEENSDGRDVDVFKLAYYLTILSRKKFC